MLRANVVDRVLVRNAGGFAGTLGLLDLLLLRHGPPGSGFAAEPDHNLSSAYANP